MATEDQKKADIDLAHYAERLVELDAPVGSEETTVECKGIMLIGTFRKIPISDRKEPDFPDPWHVQSIVLKCAP